MKVKLISIMVGFTAMALAMLSSCKTDTVSTVNEHLTTVKIITQRIYTQITTSDTFQYVNFDETRPNPAYHVDTVRLKAHASYSIQIMLLNEAANPTIYLTDTIIARADNHLIIYSIDPSEGLLTMKISDKDSKGLPLGLMNTWTTQESGFGLLRMLLRHQQGSKNGTQTPGSNDFEADFPVLVK